MHLQVSDNGIPKLKTECAIAVDLIDVNENMQPPLFDDIAHEASVYGRGII